MVGKHAAAWALTLLAGIASLNVSAAEQPAKSLAAHYGIPDPAAIAHRGDSWNAPEETRAAFILAREEGADYLEADLQRTKDGVLIALHDTNLKRTTNVAERFPDRADAPVSDFTLAELKSLDVGSWFNKAHPERARSSFKGLKIVTLDELISIAEGGKNKPGLYLETKEPKLFPGIEKDLRDKLAERGWLSKGAKGDGDVNVASTRGRVILETFERDSLVKLNHEMPDVPKILLLWIGDGYIPAAKQAPRAEGESDASYYAKSTVRSRDDYYQWLDFAKAHGAEGVGPATRLADGGEWSYMDMTQPWMNEAAHQRGLLIHPYTIDKPVDFKRFQQLGVDGMFANDIRALLSFYKRPAQQSVDQILKAQGF
ncbi:glycerophosphodiester phosphodiesterase [Carnimonas bestiolae]|uniref:glycerophosphodiester phosphodiesterase n=1 Tax=Carnimonas bestiolae TaxID=3402172 RepID=UPI003EDC2D14